MRPCRSHVALVALATMGMFCVAATVQPAVAQEAQPDDSFPSLRMGLSAGMVFRDAGMPGWAPGPDGRLTIDTPHAGGRLRLDAAYRPWSGMNDVRGVLDRDGTEGLVQTPSVDTIDILAGWGMSNAPDAPIFLEAGLLLGNRFMLFDLPAGSAGRLESEMLVGPWIRWGRVAGPIRVFGEVRALRVLTQPRWDTIGISGGMAFDFATPGWIRWVLR